VRHSQVLEGIAPDVDDDGWTAEVVCAEQLAGIASVEYSETEGRRRSTA
jgi:hypothetical protein